MKPDLIAALVCFSIIISGISIIVAVLLWHKNERKKFEQLIELPSSYIFKSSTGTFFFSIAGIIIYVITFLIFRFILSKSASIDLSVKFVLAVLLISILILRELITILSIFFGFFRRRLEINNSRIIFTNWLGHTCSFDMNDIIHYKLSEFGGSRIQFSDKFQKKHKICIYLSPYSIKLLKRYLEYYLELVRKHR